MARRRKSSERLFTLHIARTRDINYPNFLRANADAERIAFVDETYYAPRTDKTSLVHPGYYALSATVVEAEDIDARELLKEANDGHSYWHTSEAYDDAGLQEDNDKYWLRRENIWPMLTAVGEYAIAGNNVITLHTYIPHAYSRSSQNTLLEGARAETLTALTKTLALRKDYPVDTFVFERRDQGAGDAIDKRTLRRLYDNRVIPRLNVAYTSPSTEPLLWGADLQAWATGRLIREADPQWLEHADMLHTIYDTHTLKPLTLKEIHRPIPHRTFNPTHIDLASAPAKTLLYLQAGGTSREEARITYTTAARSRTLLTGPNNNETKNENYRRARAESEAHQINAAHAQDLTIGRGYTTPLQTEATHELAHRAEQQQLSPEIQRIHKQMQASFGNLGKTPQASAPTGKTQPSPRAPRHPSRGTGQEPGRGLG